MKAAVAAAVAVALSGCLSGTAHALSQTPRCLVEIDSVGGQGHRIVAGADTNYFAGGNVYLHCQRTSTRMRSDSVASYGARTIQFIGHVQYRDSTLAMDTDFGTYHRAAERWEARGRVVTHNRKTGSKLTGPMLDYYREVRGLRDTFELIAKQRPRIEYVTLDSLGNRTEPYIIVADRVRFRGNDQMWGGGAVTIDRSDFTARGDSLHLDTGKGSAGTLLGGNPVLRGATADSFTLHGTRIDFRLQQRALTYLIASGAARVVSKEWELVADTIALDIEDGKVIQALAWGDKTRPFATSTSYAMRADSLALDIPGQQLREIRGFGGAWLGGDVDSASGERNWMRGDTVLATFAERDSAGTRRTALQRIDARRGAQSYHVDVKRRSPGQPSINYARGDAIIVTMRTDERGGVERVDVRGQADGVYLEAAPATTPADSTPRPPATPPGSRR